MRTLRIEITDEQNGKKRVAFRTFEATAILLLEPQVAGEGLLTLAHQMVKELDEVKAEIPKAETPKAESRKPEPEGPPPSRNAEDPGFTTKRIVKKAVSA